jgi:hypothetical protein
MDQLAQGLGSRTDACFTDLYSSVQAYLATSPQTAVPHASAVQHTGAGGHPPA